MFVCGYPLLRYVLLPAIRRGLVHVDVFAASAAAAASVSTPQVQASSKGSKINYHPYEIDDVLSQEVQDWVELYKTDPVLQRLTRTMHALDERNRRKLVEMLSSPMPPTPPTTPTAAPRSRSSNPLLDSRVWLLGTGSAIPGVYRNVTGIFLQVPHCALPAVSGLQEAGSGRSAAALHAHSLSRSMASSSGSLHPACDFRGVLLDCGEGSWQQLMKMYTHAHPDVPPAALARDMIARIGLVWVSHPHADHHLGLIQLLLQRSKLRENLYGQHPGGLDGAAVAMDADASAGVAAGAGVIPIPPMVVVAPPEVLAFIDAYAAVDPAVAGKCMCMCMCMCMYRCMQIWIWICVLDDIQVCLLDDASY